MEDVMRKLLESVTDNDLIQAKKCVKVLLENNDKKCDRLIKNNILNKLNTSSLNMVELPYNLKGLVEVENVELTFNEKRYVATKEDENMIDKVINAYKVNDKLIEYNIRYLNSLLLYGVPGCGKTMLGKYIAYKLKVPFAYLNFSNLISSYLGKTGENIQKVFDYISSLKCVFMLDEIDAIGIKRGTDRVGELSRIVINLMQSLDKFDNGSIIIGATNREDMIDEALKRRFSLKYEMEPPNNEVQFKIVEAFLNTIPEAKFTDIEISSFLNTVGEKTCANITNTLVNRIVSCIVANKKVSLV